MKLKVLKTFKANDVDYAVGTVIEVEAGEFAQKLIADGNAELHAEIKKVEAKVEQKVEAKDLSDKNPDIKADTKIEVKPESKSFGQMLQMVAKGEKIPEDVKVRASSVKGMRRASVEQKASIGQDHTSGDGTELTQSDFMSEIQAGARDVSVLWKKVKQVEVGGSGLKFPQANESSRVQTSLFGGVRFYVPGEGVDVTVSKIAFTSKDLALVKLAALAGATEEILADANLLESFIVDAYREGLAWTVDNEILRGSLSAVANPLVNSTTGVAVTVANPCTYANLVSLYSAIHPALRSQAEWYMSNDRFIDCLNVVDAGNRLVFVPGVTGSISAAIPGTIFGLPVNIVSQLPAGGTTGSIVLTVPSKFILAVKAGGVKQSVSDQLYFLSDQIAYKFTYRLNGAPQQASKVTLVDSTVVSATAYDA